MFSGPQVPWGPAGLSSFRAPSTLRTSETQSCQSPRYPGDSALQGPSYPGDWRDSFRPPGTLGTKSSQKDWYWLLVRVFAENLVGLGFLWCVPYIKPILTQEKIFAVGKSGPKATCNLFFRGLGCPWVGEFDGFIIIFICFPTQQNLVCIANTLMTTPRGLVLVL